MEDFDKEKIIKITYWLITFFIFILQLIFTFNSMSQIRYEELAESVRNVYWFQNRLIYDGTSSNVGWYSILFLIYNIFGFSLFTAKIFRLFLFLVSIFCLAKLLKKFLGVNKSFLPLITIGLSPTFLFFNSLQAQFGIDLQTIPILLYLILTLDFKSKIQSYIKQILIGFISILTWTSYPTFIYYLPALIFLYIWHVIKNQKISHFGFHIPTSNFPPLTRIFLPLLSFLSPLIFFFIYIKNRNLMFYDETTQSGIFRGAGKLDLNLSQILQNLNKLFIDLFDKGNSYYFEVSSSDFSNFYPVITVLFVLTLSVILIIKNKKLRLPVLITLFTLFLTLIISSVTSDPSKNPGLRRNTGVIVSFYILYTICWHYVSTYLRRPRPLRRSLSEASEGGDPINRKSPGFVPMKMGIKLGMARSILIIFLFLPIHHFISFPANLISLKTPSPYQYTMWFGLTKNPADSLKLIATENIKNDLPLSCKDKKGQNAFCRYNETFAAVSGYCLWNKLECKKITGFDNKTKKLIPLSTKLWEKYYWPH